MKALRQHWAELQARYAALSRREQLLLAAALVVGPLLIGNALIADPQRARAVALQRDIARQSSALAEMQAQVVQLQQQLNNDPDAQAKAELAALKAERAGLDDELRAFGSTLVRPEEMSGLLERLLARQPGLRLVSLTTLAPRSVLGDKDDGGKGSESKSGDGKKRPERQFDLYSHGMEIRVEGNFGDLLAYVSQLEQLQKKLLWGQLQYKVLDYPKAEMTLMLYTLSPDRAWLAL